MNPFVYEAVLNADPGLWAMAGLGILLLTITAMVADAIKHMKESQQ